MAAQQFSLRWNNYSHHITTTFDDLRAGDELTDVTLSCEGKRIKAHKMLLSACSVYFRDTFRENPCKHPVIILKGVTYVDLQAVVTFMYNGQVNVTQERLPFFLQTAELLQIKGLTDMNEKDESNANRPHASTLSTNTSSSSAVPHTSSLDSAIETPEISQRPPTPKRKRFAMTSQNTIEPSPSTSSMGIVGFSSQASSAAVISGGSMVHGVGGVGNGLTMSGPSITNVTGSGGSSGPSLINPHSVVIPPDSNSTDTFPGGALVKYEDDDLPEDDDYDKNDMSEDNDNSVQDILGNMETGALGSYRGGGSGLPGSSSSMNKDLSGADTSSHAKRRVQSDERKTLRNTLPDVEIEELDDSRAEVYAEYDVDEDDVVLEEEDEQEYIEGENFDDVNGTNECNETDFSYADYEVQEDELEEEVPVKKSTVRRSLRQLPKLKGSPSNFIANRLKAKAAERFKRSHQLRQSSSSGSSLRTPTTPNFSLTQQILQSQSSSASSSKQSMGEAGGQYVCNLCGKRYVHHRSLNDHKKFHSGATTCPICKKAFSKVANMRAHFAAQHVKELAEMNFQT